MKTKSITFILTSSIRVEVADDADVDKITDNLKALIGSGYDNGAFTNGCHDGTEISSFEYEVDDIEPRTDKK